MLIEFTGCTGAGKTTFLQKVMDRLRESNVETISSVELAGGLLGRWGRNNPKLQNIVLDFFALPRAVLSLKRNLKFYNFSLKVLFRCPDSFIGAMNRVRSIIRKVGINELLLEKNDEEKIIFIDEGTVHAMHNIFVYADFPITQDDIKKFSELVPLPDMLICISAPKDIILKRTLSRKDPPARFDPRDKMANYIERALAVFDELCYRDEIKEKIFRVDLLDGSSDEMNSKVDEIADLIMKTRRMACDTTS